MGALDEDDIYQSVYNVVSKLPGNYVIHKYNDDIHLFPVAPGDNGPDLFCRLHNKHEDIIQRIIRYGWYLLYRRLHRFTVVK